MRNSASRLVALVLGTLVLRMIWASSIGLGTDESYHYLYTVHQDLSYFDHPPMMALVAEIGPRLLGGATSAPAVRLGFILLFAGSTILMARLTASFHGERAGLIAAAILNITAYYTAAAGAFVLPDGPLLFFWLLTLERFAAAIREPERPGRWLGVGLAWGCAMLSKYHAILLLPGIAAFLCIEPGTRRALWRNKRGPLLALLTGLIVFSPVLIWNAEHGWASFLFQGGRAVNSGGLKFRPEGPLAALGGPIAYLLPWIWLPLIGILIRELWRIPAGMFQPAQDHAEIGRRLFTATAIVPIGLFLVIACIKPILPHWSLIGYACLIPLLGLAWGSSPVKPGFRLASMGGAAIVFAFIFWIQTQTGIAQKTLLQGMDWFPSLAQNPQVKALTTPSKAAVDPSLDSFGWDEVARELERRGLLDRSGTFLFTGNWRDSGQLGYAARHSKTPVLCYNANDARGFAFWSRSTDWLNQDGILVSMDEKLNEPGGFRAWFTNIEPICDRVLERSGVPARRMRIFLCRNQKLAFPFDRAYGGGVVSRIAATAGETSHR
ncbi:MAG: hypothetical protein ABS79_07995 [Planctomycetes bacterium SCN 63-9]|nr:MAG: hypothetical protein ABS79_07995 [Planctomycetes bacterium SCN 63-9]